MKTNVTVVVLLAVLLGMAGTALGQNVNVVTNSTFATAVSNVTGPIGQWQLNKAVVTGSFQQVASKGYLGQYALAICTTACLATQDLPACSGSNYTISFSLSVMNSMSTTDTIGISFGKTTLFSGTVPDLAATANTVYTTGSIFTYTVSADSSGIDNTTPLVFSVNWTPSVGLFYLSAVSVMGAPAFAVTTAANPNFIANGNPTLNPYTGPSFPGQPEIGYYAPGTTVTIKAPISALFDHWTFSDTSASLSSSTANPTTLTTGSNKCVLTAYYNYTPASPVINRVPFDISGAFNMNCMAGPVTVSQATSNATVLSTWMGLENGGGTVLTNSVGAAMTWANFGTYANRPLAFDTSSNDGLAAPNFQYYLSGTNPPFLSGPAYQTVTGSQGFPENGIIYSVADTTNQRTYCIASVSGNSLLPGNWADPPYISASNGTLLGSYSPSTIYYSPSSYTYHNNPRNAVLVGNPHYTPVLCASRTAAVQPGYYSDVNFLLAGVVTYGCGKSQIRANYADVVNGSSSVMLYAWPTTNAGPYNNNTTGSAGFTLAYSLAACIVNTGPPARPRVDPTSANLWEFATPLTLDPNRVLVSLTFSNAAVTTDYYEMAVFGATATANSSASNTLTLNQTTGGTISASQSGVTQILTGYPYGATVKLTASNDISQGYHFGGWTITPAGAYAITGNSAIETLTIYGNVTVAANFSANVSYSGTTAITGSGTISLSDSGPYTAGQVITLSATAAPNWGFNQWLVTGTSVLGNQNALTTTMTVNSDFNLTAVFNSFSGTTAITGNGSISVPAAPYAPGQVITISATAAQGFTLVKWLVTGTSVLGDQNAATTSLTVNGNFTLTAVFAILPAQLQLSGGFNECSILGPAVSSQGTAYARGQIAWLGREANGFAGLAVLTNLAQAEGLMGDASAAETQLPGPWFYKYYVYQNNTSNSYTYTGNQGLPENGLLTSKADGRTYMIASVSGNTLLPGDWTEPAFDISKSGTTISGSGASAVIYGSTTFTASNPKFNALVVGQDTYYTPSWMLTSLTATFTPGYYTNINFAMKAGGFYNTAITTWYGAAGVSIVANYVEADVNGSTSQLLYNFVQGEMTPNNVNAANFNTLYTCNVGLQDQGTRFATNTLCPVSLFEFSTPRALDPTRQLASISLTYSSQGYNLAQFGLFGATATPYAPGFMQLVTVAAPVGTGTVTPSTGFFSAGSSLTITATPSTGYNFVNWVASDSDAIIANSTAATTTLTTGSAYCLLTASFTPQVCTLALTTSGNGTVTANVAGPYAYGQYVPLTITPSTGWVLSTETLSNCTYATNSLHLLGNATAQFNFTQPSYTVTGAVNIPAGGAISWSPTGTQHYGTVVTFSVTPNQYYYLIGWILTGAGNWDPDVTSTTITAQVLSGNLTMTAFFDYVSYTETGSPSAIGEGSATMSPSGGFTPGNSQNVALLTATASDGWVFSYWSLPPGSIDSITPSVGAANYMTHLYVYDNNYLPTANFAAIVSILTSAANPTDSGTVTLDGVDSTTGTIGQVINLVATAAPGYTFSYWTVTATDSDSVAYVTIDFSSSVANQNAANTTLTIPDFGPVDLGNAPITDMNLTVTANFVTSGGSFSVTVNQTAGGTVSVSDGPLYALGATPTITAVADPGYSFTSWSVTGDTAATSDSQTTLDPISANVTLAAVFTATSVPGSEGELPANGGTISLTDSGPYNIGQVVGLTANPAAGFTFLYWTVTGPSTLSSSVTATASLTVEGAFTLDAYFTADIYNVTLSQPAGGTIAADSPTASYGQVVTLSQTPADSNHVFQGYLVTSGTSQITGGDLLTVTGDVTVTGSYTAEVFSATAVTSTNWVYQNTRVTTADRHQIHLTVNMVDTWGNTSYTATVSQTGPGVVTPALTWVSGTTVTPTGAAPVVWTVPASTTFSGYLLGGRVSGAINSTANLNLTGNCTLTVRVQGNVSGPANLATTPTVTIFVRPLGGMAGANSVTTTDKNDLNSRLNGGLLVWDPNIWNLDGISGPTTTQKNILNTLLNGATLQ